MVFRMALLAFSCLLSLSAMAEAPVFRNDWGTAIVWGAAIKDPPIHAVLTDRANTVWGLVGDVQTKRYRILARWSEIGWEPAKLTYSSAALEHTKSHRGISNSGDGPQDVDWLDKLYPGPDGTVFATSGFPGAPSIQLRGDRARWTASRDKLGRDGVLLEDWLGVWWVTWGPPNESFVEGPRNYTPAMRIDMEKSVLHELFWSAKMEGVLALEFARDVEGRFWFTNANFVNGRDHFTPQTIVILDPEFDAAKTPIETLGAGLPPTFILSGSRADQLNNPQKRTAGHKVNFTVPKDENTVWLGMMDYMLKAVNVHTLSAEQVQVSPGQDMRSLTRIVQYNGTWYGSSSNSLWQEKDGIWSEIVKSSDGEKKMASDFGLDRPYLGTELGLWIGAYNGNGAFLISREEKRIERFDWHRGFPLQQVDAILRLPNSKLMFVTYNGSQFVCDENALLQKTARSTSYEPVELGDYVKQDAAGYIWKADSVRLPLQFSRWESGKWRSFKPEWSSSVLDKLKNEPLTRQQQLTAWMSHVYSMTCDTLGRLWFIDYEGGNSKTMILTPPAIGAADEGTWVGYSSYGDALVGELERKPLFLREYQERISPMFLVAYGPKNKVAYVDNESVLWYDGTEWKSRSKRKDFKIRDSYVGEYVCYDASGQLQYVAKDRYVLGAAGTWNAIPQSDYATVCQCATKFLVDDRVTAPEFAPPNPDVCVQDRQGMYWLQYGPKVFRAAYGVCLPVFSDEELTPFGHGQWVRRVLSDPSGSSFIQLTAEGSGGGTSFLLAPQRQPSPVAQLTGRMDGANTVVLEPRVEPVGSYLYIWRMDTQNWSSATNVIPIRVDHVPSGKHFFELRAIGEHLETITAPVSAAVDVTIHDDSIEQWLAALSAHDSTKRNEAVTSLAANPAQALPRLRKARTTANPDTQWWIDSAIQRCEEALSRTKTK